MGEMTSCYFNYIQAGAHKHHELVLLHSAYGLLMQITYHSAGSFEVQKISFRFDQTPGSPLMHVDWRGRSESGEGRRGERKRGGEREGEREKEGEREGS